MRIGRAWKGGKPAFPTISQVLTPFALTAEAPALPTPGAPNPVSLTCGSADGTGQVGYVNIVAFVVR